LIETLLPSVFDLVELLEQAVAEHPIADEAWGDPNVQPGVVLPSPIEYAKKRGTSMRQDCFFPSVEDEFVSFQLVIKALCLDEVPPFPTTWRVKLNSELRISCSLYDRFSMECYFRLRRLLCSTKMN